MEKGEKYIDIKLVGHEFIRAFPNKKTNDKQPDFKADGIAIWVREVKEKTENQQTPQLQPAL